MQLLFPSWPEAQTTFNSNAYLFPSFFLCQETWTVTPGNEAAGQVARAHLPVIFLNPDPKKKKDKYFSPYSLKITSKKFHLVNSRIPKKVLTNQFGLLSFISICFFFSLKPGKLRKYII